MSSDSIETRFKHALDAGKINGAVLCATDAAGHFVYNNAVGHRTMLSGEEKPQKLDDILCLASATKLITTIAALQCVENGLLTLDGDLVSVASELAVKQVLTGFADDVPMLEPLSSPITLEMLLTHSFGQSYSFLDPKMSQWRNKFSPVKEGERRSVEESFDYPLSFQPGTDWMYGPGLDWAGRIVERVTGQMLGEYLQQRVFKPLGISDAQFYPVTQNELQSRLVDLNPQDPDCLGIAILGGKGEMNAQTKGNFGGHGLFMTALDYIKVLRSLLVNDGVLLKPATVDDMFTDHLTSAAGSRHQETLSGPLGPFFRPDPDTITKTGHGLGGLLTLEDVDGLYGEHSLTWSGGLTIVWFIDRKNDLCGIGAIQPKLPIHGSDRILYLKQLFCKDIYRKHAEWKKQQEV